MRTRPGVSTIGKHEMETRSERGDMTRNPKAMTPQEFVHDVSGIGFWLLACILLVLAIGTALEALVTT